MSYGLLTLILLVCVGNIVSPPVDPKGRDSRDGSAKEPGKIPDEMKDLAYMHYLQQVVQVLGEDEEFSAKSRNITKEELESGRFAESLQFVNNNIRSRLDELKRIEVDRLRTMIQLQNNAADIPENLRRRIKVPKHLDLSNPHTFEMEDLQNLIKTATRDIEKLNEQRKEDFKHYEMEKAHAYRESLKNMTEEERKAAESKHQEMINKHKDHPEVHHPGSKQQLEEVWEDVDKLPKVEFDPKTFFRLHDLNGDGYLDEEEVKAIIALEVRKMYNISNEEDDPVEMHEEFSRMEEHIFKEADINGDRLISLEEFLNLTKKADFEEDPGWKGIDEQQIYTPEELEAYERELAEQAAKQAAQANQQYAYQPVEGAVPNNQGVQIQPLQGPQGPVQQQDGHPVPVQISQGEASHPGDKTGQPIPPVEAKPNEHPNPN